MPLVTSKEMFKKAYAGGYAIGAFNVNNMELIQGIVDAAKEERAPLILQVSKEARDYARPVYLRHLVEAAIEDSGLPICLHLDHGENFEICKAAIEDGFTSVMIDASDHAFNENVEITRRVADFAHDRGGVVEAELGVLGSGGEGYTDPNEVEEFVKKTEVDSLAIAIGTCHGAFKFKGAPSLRFDILDQVAKRLPDFPIVLHGASSILPEYVDLIEKYDGSLYGAKGVPEEMLRRAASSAVCKINIDSDLRLAFTAAVRKHLSENPAHFDPRKYLAPARATVKECVQHKLAAVLGCSGKV